MKHLLIILEIVLISCIKNDFSKEQKKQEKLSMYSLSKLFKIIS